jgi:pyruvate-formate lyase-activating enzyme
MAQTTPTPEAAQKPSEGPKKTRRRVLTRRGVLWLGQTCNQRCYFCYFLDRIAAADHPEHPFMDLDKAKAICWTLRKVYGNNAIDIQGGEPTIYEDIIELVRYCREIGLLPTLITNGLRLARPGELEKYKEAGVRDFLVSLHGLGDIHDEVVDITGAHEDIMEAISRMRDLDIPFRFNCTMSKPVVPQLVEVAQAAVEYGALAVNYIAFNPYEDQGSGPRTCECVPRYSDIKPILTEALDLLEEAGIEANVRYLPLCIAEERHRKNFYNFQQLPYDLHEWDYQSWLWTGLQPQRMQGGGLTPPFGMGVRGRMLHTHPRLRRLHEKAPFVTRGAARLQKAGSNVSLRLKTPDVAFRNESRVRAHDDAGHVHVEACQRCNLKAICDGFHSDYTGFFGCDEAEPITEGPVVDDPTHFIRRQEKIVMPEDEHWAL